MWGELKSCVSVSYGVVARDMYMYGIYTYLLLKSGGCFSTYVHIRT